MTTGVLLTGLSPLEGLFRVAKPSNSRMSVEGRDPFVSVESHYQHLRGTGGTGCDSSIWLRLSAEIWPAPERLAWALQLGHRRRKTSTSPLDLVTASSWLSELKVATDESFTHIPIGQSGILV